MYDRDCSTKHDPHHVVKRKVIERHLSSEAPEVIERAVHDQRNIVTLCALHHARLHGATVRLTELPEGFDDFLDEFGLRPIWDGIKAKELPTHRRLEI